MSDTTTSPDDGGPGPPQPMPSAPPGGGPPGGGGISPVLAALARARGQVQPTQPGMGTHGGALHKVAMAVELLQQALPALPSGSQHRRAVLTALTHLDRMGGAEVPQAAQQIGIGDMMRAQQRNAILQRIMAQRGGPGPPGNQPSTPMPGA